MLTPPFSPRHHCHDQQPDPRASPQGRVPVHTRRRPYRWRVNCPAPQCSDQTGRPRCHTRCCTVYCSANTTLQCFGKHTLITVFSSGGLNTPGHWAGAAKCTRCQRSGAHAEAQVTTLNILGWINFTYSQAWHNSGRDVKKPGQYRDRWHSPFSAKSLPSPPACQKKLSCVPEGYIVFVHGETPEKYAQKAVVNKIFLLSGLDLLLDVVTPLVASPPTLKLIHTYWRDSQVES